MVATARSSRTSLANIALDLIGQATLFLKLAGAARARAQRGRPRIPARHGRFRNLLLAETRGDFAVTVVRQLLFGVYAAPVEALSAVADTDVAGVAAAPPRKRYHVRHATQWVVTLGSGTGEPPAAQTALDDLWRYTGELFIATPADLAAEQAAPA
jgi:ring-1,2-phenylacetyl-CoA epoxidase subunit PaaC